VLQSLLPEGVSFDILRKAPEAIGEERSFMVLQLIATLSPTALRSLTEQRVAGSLLQLPGLAGLELRGGEERELRASLESDLRRGRNVDGIAFSLELAQALRDKSMGTLSTPEGQVVLQQSGRRDSGGLAALSIDLDRTRNPIVRFRDFGHFEQAGAPLQSISRIDGKSVVTLTLHRTPGSHLLRVAADVRKAVEEIRRELPAGTELLIADDRSEDVRKQLHDLASRGGLGLLLLLGVLFFMLRSGKAVAIALFAVMVSLAAAILLFKPLGLTLNVLTIAGLVLLFGLLIDNAVVVIERLQAELASRRDGSLTGYAAAAGRAVKGVWLPLLGGTLTTCAVFLPMVYLSGELRSLFASFAVLSALTLGFSLLASVILIPNLGQGLRGHQRRGSVGPRRLRGLLLAPYGLARRHPRSCFVILLLAIGLPTPLLPDFIQEPSEGWRSQEDRDFAARYNRTLGSDTFREARQWLDPLLGGVTRPFLKDVELGKRWDFPERPEVRVWIQLPAGSGIERADERIRPFEDEARRSPAVKRTLVNVSGRTARMTVLFHDGAMDTSEPYLLRERLVAQALQVAGMEVSVSGLVPMGFYSGLGQVSGFTVHAFGPTYEKLEEVSKDFARRLERYPRVAEVDINAAGYRQPPAREVIRFHWGADAVARTGLSAREMAAVLRPQLWRETPDFYADLEGDPRMPVRIVMEGAERLNLATLLHRPLAAGVGGPVRLADHATLSIEKDPPVIERIDQQYRRTLQVYYRGPYRMGKEMLEKEIADLTLPPGYRVERPSYEFFDAAVKRQFFWLILGTVGLVFLVIAAVLESWRLAAVVMLSVPLSWIGIALAFVWTGQNFAEGAFIGVVLTVGIAVNDAILLADRYRRLRLARPTTPVSRLALLALRQRLRPMWTTTLTSIASMLPLLVIPDAGNFWVGLAVTVVGGLVASTLLAPAATLALLSWRARSISAVVSASPWGFHPGLPSAAPQGAAPPPAPRRVVIG
jgi:multidrug efflux pump subunit AcrB